MSNLLLIVPVLVLSLVSQCFAADRGKVFVDYADDATVLAPGAPGEWDAGAIGSVSVTEVHGRYHMYYEAWGQLSVEGKESEYGTLQIGHATSSDGIRWKKDPANPVLTRGAAGQWDEDGVWDPFVIYEDGLFKLWFGGRSKPDVPKPARCDWGYATSTDGSHFDKREKLSRLGGVEDDHVVHAADGKYYMFYWDRSKAPWDLVMKDRTAAPSGLFVAISPDETHFDFGHAQRLQIDGQPTPVKFTHVIFAEGQWVMVYGEAAVRGVSVSTGIATSTDLVHWTKRAFPIIKGHDAELLKTGNNCWNLYYAPEGTFDMPGASVRLAQFRGRLSELFEK